MQNLTEVNLHELSTSQLIDAQSRYVSKKDGTWLQSLQILKERGIDVRQIGFYLESAGKCSAIHMAAFYDNIEVLEFLLDEAGEKVDRPDQNGGTALIACLTKFSWSAETGTVDFLLDRKADPKKENVNGLTPLHLAASHGIKDALEALKDAGADINATNKFGDVPLSSIIYQNSHVTHERLIECVKWFLENEAKLELVKPFDHTANPVRHFVASKSEEQFWADLEKQVDYSTPDRLLRRIVKREAFSVENLNLVHSLLMQGADPTTQENTEDLTTFDFFCTKFLPKNIEDLIKKTPHAWKLIVDTLTVFILKGVPINLSPDKLPNLQIVRALFNLGLPFEATTLDEIIKQHPEYEQFRMEGVHIHPQVYSPIFITQLEVTVGARIGQDMELSESPESPELQKTPVSPQLATEIGTIIAQYHIPRDDVTWNKIKEEVKDIPDNAEDSINFIKAAKAHTGNIISFLDILASMAHINDWKDDAEKFVKLNMPTNQSLQKFLTIWLIGHIRRCGEFDPSNMWFIRELIRRGASLMQKNLVPLLLELSFRKDPKRDEKSKEALKSNIDNSEHQMLMDAIIAFIEDNAKRLNISDKVLISLMNLTPMNLKSINYYDLLVNNWDQYKHMELIFFLKGKKAKVKDKNEAILYEKMINFLYSVDWIVDQIPKFKKDEKAYLFPPHPNTFNENDLFSDDTSLEEKKSVVNVSQNPFGSFYQPSTEQKNPAVKALKQEITKSIKGIISELKVAFLPLKHKIERNYLAELEELKNSHPEDCSAWLRENGPEMYDDINKYATAIISRGSNTDSRILKHIQKILAILDNCSELADEKQFKPMSGVS